MAATTVPLVWDFYQLNSNAVNLGTVVEYADTKAQSLYLDNNLKTVTTIIDQGHWSSASYNPEEIITDSVYDFSSWDHPENGYLMGVAQNSNDLYFIRYRYRVPVYD